MTVLQIYNRALAGAGWRPYSGQNPHTHHMHVSIRPESRDDLSAWPWSAGAANLPSTPSQPVLLGHALAYPGTSLQRGSHGVHVRAIQHRLKELGYRITIDGNFGLRTHDAVVAFQRKKNLLPDGIVGRKTWTALVVSR